MARLPSRTTLLKWVILSIVPAAALAGVAVHFLGSKSRPYAGPLIAFTRQGSGEQDQIVVIRPDGSKQRALTSLDANDSNPAWSPDGTEIVFQNVDGALRVMTSNGQHVRVVSRGPGFAAEEHPQWSPDGKQIAFNVVFGSHAKTLYVVNADGTGLRSLKVPGVDPSWSPDGTVLTYVDLNGRVSEVALSGGPPHALTSAGCTVGTPAWSPDGHAIAFVAGGLDCAPNEILVMRTNGTGLHALIAGEGFYGPPSWSPDGTSLTFARGSASAIGDVYVIRADGTHRRKLTSDGHDFDPAWRPNT